MTDADIHAFTPAPVPPPVRRPRRIWPWVLAGLAVMLLLLTGGIVAALLSLVDGAHQGWHVVVNGEPWDGWDAIDMNLNPLHGLWAVLGVGTAAFVLLVVLLFVLPASVLLTLLLAGGAVALGLSVAVGAIGLVLAVLLSPLWLFALALWLMLRRRRAPAARMGA